MNNDAEAKISPSEVVEKLTEGAQERKQPAKLLITTTNSALGGRKTREGSTKIVGTV